MKKIAQYKDARHAEKKCVTNAEKQAIQSAKERKRKKVIPT